MHNIFSRLIRIDIFKMIVNIVVIVTIVTCSLANPDSRSEDEARLVRGEDAEISEVPYTVYVSGEEFNVCTGAIISKRYVLTAAHCTRGNIKHLEVRAGSTQKDTGYTLHKAQNVTRHEKFNVDNNGRSSFDIAVIRVDKEFNYTKNTQPIKLFGPNQKIPSNAMGKISGWGRDEYGTYDIYLKKLMLRIVDSRKCNQSFKTWGGILAGQFCAENRDKKRYPCYGDSGAPLVIKDQVAGINIYGGNCDKPYSVRTAPSVFSEVAYFREWIDKHVEYDH